MSTRITRNAWLLLAAISALLFAMSAQAASFDCAKARTKAERIICDTPKISKLDDELNAAYKAALKDVKQADTIKQAQKQWMKERNGCADAKCIKQSYEKQISSFDKYSPADIQPPSKSLPTEIKTGQYKMISDSINVPQSNGISIVEKHAEVCSAFMKVLEALPPFPPMACDVKIPPEFTNFKTPEWADVDVWENRGLWLQLARTPPKDQADVELRLLNLRERINEKMIFFRSARFDIDNDGVLDSVLKISTDKCDPAHRNSHGALLQNYSSYIVYDPLGRKIDANKMEFYSRYWSHYISIFSYNGVTYYVSPLSSTTREPYFGELDQPDKFGASRVKYSIKIFRPLTMEQGLRTVWKQPAALGCEYLYLPPKNEGGY